MSINSLQSIDRTTQNKSLYTVADRRLNLYENSIDLTIKTKARSIACIVKSSLLHASGDQHQFNSPLLKDRIRNITGTSGLGPNEHFADEPSLGIGTAFLVGKNLAMTAAHCVCDKDSNQQNKAKNNIANLFCLIFDFKIAAPNFIPSKAHQDNVYRIKNILKHSKGDDKADWALLELDRDVVDSIAPLKIDFVNEPLDEQDVYMLGHPIGLPMKFTEGQVKPKQFPSQVVTPNFDAAIDAFAGNSGSPIFNKKTHEIVGMLISGITDWDTSQGLAIAHHPTAIEIQKYGYEQCQKMSALPASVVKIIDKPQSFQRTSVDTLWNAVISIFKDNQSDDDHIDSAIHSYELATKEGFSCKHYELALYLQKIKPDLAQIYFDQAIKSGFYPLEAYPNKKMSTATNDNVLINDNAEVFAITSGQGNAQNQDVSASHNAFIFAIAGDNAHAANRRAEAKGNSTLVVAAGDPNVMQMARQRLHARLNRN